jgi:hypothetical protein
MLRRAPAARKLSKSLTARQRQSMEMRHPIGRTGPNLSILFFGPLRLTDPNPLLAAEQEKSEADVVKGGVPGRVTSFKGHLTAAQAQDCLSPAQLSAAGNAE